MRGGRSGSFWRRVVAGGCGLLPLALTSGEAARAVSSTEGGDGRLDPRITEIMRKPDYPNAQWGPLQQDPESGRVVHSRFAEQFFIPGSVAKLFGTSRAWDTLGGDHRFRAPVYAVGERRGSTLDGDLGVRQCLPRRHALNNRLAVGAITIAGHLDKGNGRVAVFFAGVDGASTPTTDVNGVLDIADDLAMISAYLQEGAARREHSKH
ncbi:D-alanyl-D-alanine carboxypeptidase [Streptomyces cyaneofuscatus]|uniref:D-alanyl-D-alanine carboxypeptidase n=1 Tax=Streptomyces cyaneofuscatus TaxID=66883 RepID=UPI0036830960